MHLKPIFLLFSIFCFALQMKAQRFVGTQKDTVQEKIGISWSFSLGYSSIPTRLDEMSIFADVEEHPLLDEELPAVKIRDGVHIATSIYLNENWYSGISFSYSSIDESKDRGKDQVYLAGLNLGYEQALKYDSRDFFAAFELGIASYSIRRGLVGFERYNSVRLQRSSAVFTPAVRLEMNLYNEQIYLFAQAKYFLSFYDSKRIRLAINDPTEEGEVITSSIYFDDPGVELSESARLNIQHPYELAIGLRFVFDF